MTDENTEPRKEEITPENYEYVPMTEKERKEVENYLDLNFTKDELKPFGIDDQPYDPAKTRETARTLAVFSLIFLFCLCIVGFGAAFIFFPERISAYKEFAGLFFTPLVGVLSTVLTFYFGSQKK